MRWPSLIFRSRVHQSKIMLAKLQRPFLTSALLLLAFTAVAKLISAAGSAAILAQADPVIGLPTRWVLILAGGVELAVSIVILLSRSRLVPSLLVAIVGAEFLLYRAVFQIGNFSRGCPCLGSFSAWANLPESTVNNLLWAVAVWLCIGGLFSFIVSLSLETGRTSLVVNERRSSAPSK